MATMADVSNRGLRIVRLKTCEIEVIGEPCVQYEGASGLLNNVPTMPIGRIEDAVVCAGR